MASVNSSSAQNAQWLAQLTAAVQGKDRVSRQALERLNIPGAVDIIEELGQQSIAVNRLLAIAETQVAQTNGAPVQHFRIGLASADVPPSARARAKLEAALKPMHKAAATLNANWEAWDLKGKAAPFSISAHPGATSARDVLNQMMEQPEFAPGLTLHDPQPYSGIPQNLGGLWRATSLYTKYHVLEYKGLPKTEGKKVANFERAIEAAVEAMNPKSMSAISCLFQGSSTELMSLAIELQDGQWIAVHGPHHHPWGGHIHGHYTPPADL